MKHLVNGFRNNGLTRRQWFYGLLSLIVLPPIATVVLFLLLND